ncbi:MAG: transcription termination/antitermination factor NusG [Planctomycetes bacterium]|nr:transcription termination/antitermination factor NusG [Planctomycetota bacterium]
MVLRWYVVRVQAGKEDRVRESLQKRIKAAGMESRIPLVLVPTEKVTEIKSGRKRVTHKKILPGYCMIEADLDDQDQVRTMEIWSLVRETPGFGDVLGTHSHPTPMSEEEVRKILGQIERSDSSPTLAIGFHKNDHVKIQEGPFEGFEGVVEEVDAERGRVRVMVTIFGRANPVDIEYWKVEPV